MFCNQCGQLNSNDARFCSSCGTRLETLNNQNTIVEQPSIHTQAKQIELWNPNAAANWSLLFSPAFGAYIHMKNWESLGDNDKAKSSKIWFISSIILSVLGLGFFVLIAWYFSLGKQQAKYVKEKFGDRYTRKSWGTPLLIGFSVFIVSVFLIMLIPENSNNSYQQTTTQTTQQEQTNTTQAKNQASIDWDNGQITPPEENPFAKYVQQEQTNTTRAELEKAHYNAIFTAHPDAKSIIQSQDFSNWVNNQPTYWKNYYNQVLDKGNSSQVIDMLNDYKNGINH